VDRASAWSRLNRMKWEMTALSFGKLDNATALGKEKFHSVLCVVRLCVVHIFLYRCNWLHSCNIKQLEICASTQF
jgi:hypothetical protein